MSSSSTAATLLMLQASSISSNQKKIELNHKLNQASKINDEVRVQNNLAS
jgi:hypothetical protein